MLKKIILTFLLLVGLDVWAGENYLNSVVISNNEGKPSIILRSDDEITKASKRVEADDKIVITLKNITQSPSISTLYKNGTLVNGLVIQNEGNDELKIYIEAPDISKADIIFEKPDSTPVKANTDKSKLIWSVISILLLLLLMRRNVKVDEPNINEIIIDREKALYQNFQKNITPSINYKLKGYRKHVLKGETIRSYEAFNSRL